MHFLFFLILVSEVPEKSQSALRILISKMQLADLIKVIMGQIILVVLFKRSLCFLSSTSRSIRSES